MNAELKVAEAMCDYARALEKSPNPDVVIAAGAWEKRCIRDLEKLRKRQLRNEAARTAIAK